MPTFPTSTSVPPRSDFTTTPWADPVDGRAWVWNAPKLRWVGVARPTPKTSSAVLAEPVSFTTDAVGVAILSLPLSPGTYRVEAFVRFSANGANSKHVLTAAGTPKATGARGSYDDGVAELKSAAVGARPGEGGFWGAITNRTNQTRQALVTVTTASELLSLTASQDTASGTVTTVAAGSYLLAERLD